ncbi:Polyamine aminopropyltransferase [Usitatibacter palustris]|uniref:Polyamine aminopropyltransferase n=1 Tax=Usitatibacter palustris TaxID=2732487 RepID=A0A6M4H5H8_9PROT|nr:Polyamine aminopropyltransferase [Usitatibacter palustris]
MWSISEQEGVRYLHFGSPLVQGAMRIARPYALELEYTRDMMLPLLLRGSARWPSSVLQVGLGSGSITKFLHRYRPEARLVVVELHEDVVDIARNYFKLPEEGPKLRIELAEGFDYLARQRKPFDWIIVDGFDGDGHAGALDSASFYHSVRAHLTEQGMLSVNLVGKRVNQRAARDRISNAFEERLVSMERDGDGNSIVVAAVGDRIECPAAKLRTNGAALQKETHVEFASTVERALGKVAMSGGPFRL